MFRNKLTASRRPHGCHHPAVQPDGVVFTLARCLRDYR